MKKIRLLFHPTGTFHNLDGLQRGDVLNVPDQVDEDNAARYCALGHAEEVVEPEKENVETATAKTAPPKK